MWATMDDAFARDVSDVRLPPFWRLPPRRSPHARAPQVLSKLANWQMYLLQHALTSWPARCAQVLAHYEVDLDHGMTLAQVEKVRIAPAQASSHQEKGQHHGRPGGSCCAADDRGGSQMRRRSMSRRLPDQLATFAPAAPCKGGNHCEGQSSGNVAHRNTRPAHGRPQRQTRLLSSCDRRQIGRQRPLVASQPPLPVSANGWVPFSP